MRNSRPRDIKKVVNVKNKQTLISPGARLEPSFPGMFDARADICS